MSTGKGLLLELILEDGFRYLRVSCPQNLVPAPGQYLLAGDGSDAMLSVSKCSPLPVPLYYTDSAPQGFIAAASVPDSWKPGVELSLRGPLGHGFTLPLSARNVGLVAFEASPARLKGLIRPALKQDAAVVLVCDSNPDSLPDEVEVQPTSLLGEVVDWADYLAFDVTREHLNESRDRLGKLHHFTAEKARIATKGSGPNDAQILIHTPMPCGGVAECGVCAVTLKSGWKLACKDGPVFDWREMVLSF